jgi:hypothetical protein
VNTYGSPIHVVIYLEDIVYPGGYKGQELQNVGARLPPQPSNTLWSVSLSAQKLELDFVTEKLYVAGHD